MSHNLISIINILQLKDNYSYIIKHNNYAIIVDPAESSSIIEYIIQNNLTLKAILITHHHEDHTAGVIGILKFRSVPVYSSNKDIVGTTNIVKEGHVIDLNFLTINVMETPGHTLDHIIFYNQFYNFIFSGDTLFRLGCGRVFEGSYHQMYESLRKIMSLDNKNMVYCGHEYTLNNLKFLTSIFQNYSNLNIEKHNISTLISKNGCSIPFELGVEKSINPFLSTDNDYYKEFKKTNNFNNIEMFSYLRDLKNNF